MIRSRRGDAFLLMLDFIFLVALIVIFFKIASAFHLQNPEEPFGSRQSAMLRTYDAANAALIHLDVVARRATMAATQHVAKAGGVLVEDTRCGTYAGLRRWTSPDTVCFAQDAITEALRQETQSRLRIATSWIIPALTYDVSITEVGAGLRITGIATKDITLPILLAKSGDERAAMSLLTDGQIARTAETITPDARVDLTARSTPGGSARAAGKIAHIVIHGTATEDANGALTLYDRGATGAHYLIDTDGRITQLTREDLRVSHLPSCATAGACSIPDIEDTSIAIALVVANPQAPIAGKCPAGTKGPSDAVTWCGTPSYPAPSGGCPAMGEKMCWAPVADAQREALVNLLADITRRRAFKADASHIHLAEQIVYEKQIFGPAIAPEGQETSAWWPSMLADVALKAATQPDATAPIALSAGVEALSLPISGSSTISSCFGWRTLNNKQDLHDGLDFAGNGLDVLSAADGVVYSVCDDGVCSGLPGGSPDFGNNIIIAHGNGLFTRYSHLQEVKVARGDRVAREQVIGISGNTGKSYGAHLDFKVFTSEQSIVEVGHAVDKGVDPLCFFAAGDFSRMSFKNSQECIAYGGPITAENENLRQGCAGFDVQPSNVCNAGITEAMTADHPDLVLTRSRLDANTLSTIQTWSNTYGIDERLVFAIITQESKGDASAVSPTGCAGLGQFCWSTAYGEKYPGVKKSSQFAKIFLSEVNDKAILCTCKSSRSCTAETSGCVGDARLDPIKTAQAIPLHLKSDAQGTFSKYTDKWRFTIAAYNAGGGNIKNAVEATGISDPLWEQVVPELSAVLGAPKSEEVITYVDRVTTYWTALGGDARPALSGMFCALPGGSLATGNPKIKVREVGSYTFRPSFSIEVPDALAPLASISTQAKALYDRCDGSGGTDPNACLVDGAHSAFGNTLVSCVSDNEQPLQSLREFVADCRSSDQSACGCVWKIPTLPAGMDRARLDLYGTDARLVVTETVTDEVSGTDARMIIKQRTTDVSVGSLPSGVHSARIASSLIAQPTDAVVSIALERLPDGTTSASLVRWRTVASTSGEEGADQTLEIESTEPLLSVLLRPDGTWILDHTALACAPHKREHALCVNLTTSTRDESGVAQPLITRFALWLKDVEVPTAVTQPHAAQATGMGYLGVTFTPSTSKDVSHYRIWCAPQGMEIDETKPYVMVLGDVAATTLQRCNDQSLLAGVYTVRIVPYDIAGQRGEPAEVTTVDETNQGWMSAFTGLQDGFTEEDFLNAIVSYYTGGATLPP